MIPVITTALLIKSCYSSFYRFHRLCLTYRLNGLAMMSVERVISKGIDFTEIIDQFALRKARRQNFIKLFL